MNMEETIEYLRRQGMTEAEITKQQARLDQVLAEADEAIVWGIRAKQASTPEETTHAGTHIVRLVLRHGVIPVPAVDLFNVLTSRCVDAILTIGSMSAQIEALEARVERLRQGRE